MSYEDSERYWRDKLSSEIKQAIDNGSEMNAYGAYLLVKGNSS